MDNIVEEIFDKLLVEAEEGINYNNINIKFHALEKFVLNSSFDDCIPILVIKNKKELVNKLKQYLELVFKVKKIEYNEANIKKCIALLFANACYEDFSNPLHFIDNHIGFYLNNDFMKHEKTIKNITMKRMTLPITKETPYTFKAIINEDDNKYYLPNVNYGISNDTCFIYSVEKVTKNKVSEYNRVLEDKYDVNILALSLLLKELYNYGISKIKVVSYLPLRYSSEEQIEVKKMLENFIDLNYKFNNIIVLSNPFEIDEYMNVLLKDFEDNKIFSDYFNIDKEISINKAI